MSIDEDAKAQYQNFNAAMELDSVLRNNPFLTVSDSRLARLNMKQCKCTGKSDDYIRRNKIIPHLSLPPESREK